MKGYTILLEGEPRGVFKRGIISGTPKPGTVMQIKAATEPVGGCHTWEVFNQAADGTQAPTAVLLDDWEQGKTPADAYADGTYGKLYFPAEGEELNMLVANIAGTSDAFAIGDRLMVDDGTGLLIAETGSPTSVPFQVLETVAALTADTLVHCLYAGK